VVLDEITGVIKDDPVPIGDPPVAAVNQEIVAPACGGVADKVTVPASHRVTFCKGELFDVVVIVAGIPLMMVATTELRLERQLPVPVRAPT
jgi:hypothetical protein